MKVVLISPKGPLYRSRGGIFRKSLRYQPLTLTTLAALIPPELDVTVELIDEGIQDVPETLDADLIGMTVITGTAKRAYQLAARFRARKIPVVLGGPHVTLMPDEAAQQADAICTGYAEQSWPQLLRDFTTGSMRKIYRQGADFGFSGEMPYARRDLFDRRDFLTQAVFEATRSCAHDCEFCVAPAAWGQKTVAETDRLGDRGYPPFRAEEDYLRRSQSGIRYRLCEGTVLQYGAPECPVVRTFHGIDRP